MTPTSTARLVATIFGLIYGLALHVGGIQLTGGTKQVLAYIPGVAVIGMVVLDAWAWHLWPFRHLIRRPRVHGTWVTTIHPHPESHIPEGGNRGPITAAVVIEQSLFSIHVCQYTGESESHSTAATIRTNGQSKERAVLAFVYANQPKQKHQSRSPAHSGACELQISGHAPTEMEGAYWTRRFTAGDMRMKLLNRRVDYGSLDAVRRAERSAAAEAKRVSK